MISEDGAMTRASLDKRPQDVAAMFDDVAAKYDLTNDVLSLGQDRRWRRLVREAVGANSGDTVLDIAAGTGDPGPGTGHRWSGRTSRRRHRTSPQRPGVACRGWRGSWLHPR